MKTYYTHAELVEQYKAGLITLEEYHKANGYTNDIDPIIYH